MLQKILVCITIILAIAICAHADPVDDLCKKAFEAFTQNNADEAIRLYQKVLADYPGSKRSADAQWGIASVYGAIQHDYEKAYLARKQLVEKYPGSKWADDAVYSMIIYWHTKGWEEKIRLDKDSKKDLSKIMELSQKNIELTKSFLKNYPKSNLAPKAKFYGMAEVYRYFLKDYGKAIEVAKEIASQCPDHQETPGKYIFIGSAYEEQMNQADVTPTQRIDLARSAEKWYKEFLKRYPSHKKTKEVKEALMSIR